MSVSFQQVRKDEFDEVFTMVKTSLFAHINAVYGWDDDFQKQRLIRDYAPHWYYWVYDKQKRIGLVCFKYQASYLHLHLLIMLPDCQRQGRGKQVMQYVIDLARQQACDEVRLSSFISNQQAVSFYQGLGFHIYAKDAYFYDMSLPLSACPR